jgi:hypothetical protein
MEMKPDEFVGMTSIAFGAAILVGSIMAVVEHRERESLTRELEQWQRQEWVESLLETRRQEMLNQIKYKPL